MEGRMGARNQYPDFMDALSVSQGLALILLLNGGIMKIQEWRQLFAASILVKREVQC